MLDDCSMNSLELAGLHHRRIETSRGTGISMAIERLLTGSIRERVQDLMSTEDLIIESFKDIVKDELKAHIRNKIEEELLFPTKGSFGLRRTQSHKGRNSTWSAPPTR